MAASSLLFGCLFPLRRLQKGQESGNIRGQSGRQRKAIRARVQRRSGLAEVSEEAARHSTLLSDAGPVAIFGCGCAFQSSRFARRGRRRPRTAHRPASDIQPLPEPCPPVVRRACAESRPGSGELSSGKRCYRKMICPPVIFAPSSRERSANLARIALASMSPAARG